MVTLRSQGKVHRIPHMATTSNLPTNRLYSQSPFENCLKRYFPIEAMLSSGSRIHSVQRRM